MTSIRRRLTRELLCSTLLLLSIGLGGLYFAARNAVTTQFDSALQAKARAISTLTFQDGQQVRVTFSDHFMPGFEDRKPRDFFQLWGAGGTEIARSESLIAGTSLPRRIGSLSHPAKWNIRLPNGRAGRAAGFSFRPKFLDRQRHEEGTELSLVVASDREELDETLWQLFGLCAGLTTLLIGVTVWIIPRVLRRGLQPLNTLGEQAMHIDADSLAIRFPQEAMPAELRPIAEKLNHLLGRLEASFERERRFSADLAHELRTPLAELRSLSECALKWPENRDADLDRDVLAIANQMERLVAHILALTRGEQGLTLVNLENVRLDSLVLRAWSAVETRADERELKVEPQLAPVEAIADVALTRAILVNLFENAVDYSPMGGVIEISATCNGDTVCISISNTANNLAPEDLPKLFDRFWRKEAARSGGSHLGLGLSLCHSFARSMGWTLTARFDKPARLTLSLSGPSRVHAAASSGSRASAR